MQRSLTITNSLLLAASFSTLAAAGAVDFEQVVIDQNNIAYQRAIVDLDGDGQRDIITVSDTTLRWYRGPNFPAQTLLQLNAQTHGYSDFRADDLIAYDIDGDGDKDVVTRIGEHDPSPVGEMVWFENPRPGQITGNWIMHVVGSNQYVKDIVVADFDGDGKPDIASREHTATQIWFQNSANSWTKKQIAHPAYEGMEVGDLDGDGDPDLALNGFWLRTPSNARNGNYDQFTINGQWFNNPGDFPNNCCRVVVADVDGNGKLDVILSNSELPNYPVAWYSASNPTGSWQQHNVINELGYCHTLAAADFNNDGKLDVLAGGMPQSALSGLNIFYGNGGSNWSIETIEGLGAYCAVVGDLQNDGDIDVVNIRNWNEAPTEVWENMLNPGPTLCAADTVNSNTFNPPGDGVVDGADLAYLLGEWGNNPGSPADTVNTDTFNPPPDGKVDGADLAYLLGQWGNCQ